MLAPTTHQPTQPLPAEKSFALTILQRIPIQLVILSSLVVLLMEPAVLLHQPSVVPLITEPMLNVPLTSELVDLAREMLPMLPLHKLVFPRPVLMHLPRLQLTRIAQLFKPVA